MTAASHDPEPTRAELLAMRRQRTWLLVVAAVLQGGQYVLAPDRPLGTSAYFVLIELGEVGWRLLGALLVVGALVLFAGELRNATPWRSTGFVWVALIEFFLGSAQILHGYAPSTLILPVGLCLIEVTTTARLRRRSRTGGHGCG